MKSLYDSLLEIVGAEYVSKQQEELYIYSRDSGTAEPHMPDYVVAPKTTDEVQAIVRLANSNKVPLVPLGGGLNLAGLAIPLRGGIVLDLKRMDGIIEVNEKGRYVVVEGGTPQGKLLHYLKKHHPNLRHSIPSAPPQTTIAANVTTHGQGDLAQMFGFNSEMVNGLEVILPNGELCRVGSCSHSPFWFTRQALPDLTGLFMGWCGTTGIITKVSLKLYPLKKIRGVEMFVIDEPCLVPDVIFDITHTQVADEMMIGASSDPPSVKIPHYASIYISGDSDEEIEFRRKLIRETALASYVQKEQGRFVDLPPDQKTVLLERPRTYSVKLCDVDNDSGYEYVGGIMPVETYEDCFKGGVEICLKHNKRLGAGARVIGISPCIMFAWSYFFNRAIPESVEQARLALYESEELALKLGGTIWKPTTYGQKQIMKSMNSNTVKLMKEIRQLLDPNQIMNPGHWEVI
ncbi:FAD-binding oxidoreductase [Chloroflexota bacterium]